MCPKCGYWQLVSLRQLGGDLWIASCPICGYYRPLPNRNEAIATKSTSGPKGRANIVDDADRCMLCGSVEPCPWRLHVEQSADSRTPRMMFCSIICTARYVNSKAYEDYNNREEILGNDHRATAWAVDMARLVKWILKK